MPTLSEIVFWVLLAQAEAGGAGAGGGNGGEGGAADAGGGAGAEGADPGFFGGGWMMWAPLIIIALLFYFIMLRPRRKEQQNMQNMLANLKKNDRVQTIGGIVGSVASVSTGSKYVTLKIDDKGNVRMQVLRNAISRVITDEDETAEEDSEPKQELKK